MNAPAASPPPVPVPLTDEAVSLLILRAHNLLSSFEKLSFQVSQELLAALTTLRDERQAARAREARTGALLAEARSIILAVEASNDEDDYDYCPYCHTRQTGGMINYDPHSSDCIWYRSIGWNEAHKEFNDGHE